MFKLINSESINMYKEVFYPYHIKHIVNNCFSFTYLYQFKQTVYGFINYSIIYDRAELNYIYVFEKYRNKRVATKLINYFFKEVMKCKCINITLEVRKSNIAAIELYKKNKFIQICERENYYADGEKAILMIRKFDKNEFNIYTSN